MIRQILIPTISSLIVSACAAPEFRGSVISFGEATQAAAAAQNARLDALTDQQVADIRGQLAEDRVILVLAAEPCAALVVQGSDVSKCVVTRKDNAAIDQPETFTTIVALNKALGNYGAALSALAGDASEDAASFNASLTDLAASVDGLAAALDGSDTGTTDAAPRLQAAATSAGAIGNALFAASRVSTLRDVISDTDDEIQMATALLSNASEALTVNEVASALELALETQRELEAKASAGAPVSDIAKLQSKLFEQAEDLRRIAAVRDTYSAIGASHAKLAQDASAGASLEDIRLSVLELVRLVNVLTDASEAF